MAFEHEAIIKAQFQRLTADRAQAFAELEANRNAEDGASTMYAAERVLEVDAKLAALDNIANRMVASQQQQQQVNRYGLSPDEVGIAHTIAGNDASLSKDDREKVYAQQKQKLRYLRATGAYSDGQGSVFK